MSGQVEAHGHNWRALQQAFLARQPVAQQPVAAGVYDAAALEAALQQQWGPGDWPGPAPPLNADAAVAAMQQPLAQPRVVPPYAPLDDATAPACHGRGSSKPMRPWTAEDLRVAAGSSLVGNGCGALVARHPMRLASAYSTLTGRETPYSTAHDKFIGEAGDGWDGG